VENIYPKKQTNKQKKNSIWHCVSFFKQKGAWNYIFLNTAFFWQKAKALANVVLNINRLT